ncbi:hypothetical protein [Pseudonocardia acidicola]|uniref:Transposase n=1 Tax=Pseudonocardia acidicola TaxID=2724939 RepID=A0ABX1S7W5_9PSEU|nr:hypothetical protein [Pseudonocardia acidicola]NMH97655.1 hypothetical protein [Pseudonocardia acidicola]
MSGEHPADALDEAAEELYGLSPDDFIAARDARVAAAREAGDRESARAIGRLRRPTQAAWLANLLARERADQLDGLLGLAEGLSDAQRTLDGDTLRTLSSQRHKLVAAMAREARRLAGRRGYGVGDGTERDLRGILEAALADPRIAADLRSGRLTRTVSYSGFGPEVAEDATPRPPARRPALVPVAEPADTGTDEAEPQADERERERQRTRQERERAERRARELAAAERELADARRAAAEAEEREKADQALREEAARRYTAAREQVAELTAALDEARAHERDAAEQKREADAAAKDAARAARMAATALSWAQSRLTALHEEE